MIWLHRCHHSDLGKIAVGLGTTPLLWKTLILKPIICKHLTENGLKLWKLNSKRKNWAVLWSHLLLSADSSHTKRLLYCPGNLMSTPKHVGLRTCFFCQRYVSSTVVTLQPSEGGRCDVLGYTGWRKKAGSSQEMAKQGRGFLNMVDFLLSTSIYSICQHITLYCYLNPTALTRYGMECTWMHDTVIDKDMKYIETSWNDMYLFEVSNETEIYSKQYTALYSLHKNQWNK